MTSKTVTIAALSLLFLGACKMTESIERDIIFQSDSTAFQLPKVTNIADTLELATIQDTIPLEDIIAGTPQVQNAKLLSAQLIGMTLTFKGNDSTYNFKDFSYLRLLVFDRNNVIVATGIYNNNSTNDNYKVDVPITNHIELSEALRGGRMKYVISGVARDTVSQIINAKINGVYRLRMGL